MAVVANTTSVEEEKAVDELANRMAKPDVLRAEVKAVQRRDDAEGKPPPAKKSKQAEGAKNAVERDQAMFFDAALEGKVIKNRPPKEMTGIEPELTSVCAAFSGQLYGDIKSADDFDLSIGDIKVDVILFDDHGKQATTIPPFAVAVTGDSMMLAHRGSSQLMDWVMNFAFSPVSSSSWFGAAKSVKGQGGYSALVENDMITHEEFLIDEISKRGITQVIMTGHSLGSGMANVKHMYLEGKLSDEGSAWSALKGKIVSRNVSFSGPMTTVDLAAVDPDDTKSRAFLERVAQNSCTIIYASDIVPRGYAYLSFVMDFIDAALPDVAAGVPLPGVVRWALDIKSRLENAVESAADSEAVKDLVKVAIQYRHIGNIVYYETFDSEPLVLKDAGPLYKKDPNDETNYLRDIKYKQTGENAIEQEYTEHMFLVKGPGLAYNVK